MAGIPMGLEFLLKRRPVRTLRSSSAVSAACTFIARRARAVRTLRTVVVLRGIAVSSASARNKRRAPLSFSGAKASPTEVGLSRRMTGRIPLSGTLKKCVEFFFQKDELIRDLLDLGREIRAVSFCGHRILLFVVSNVEPLNVNV